MQYQSLIKANHLKDLVQKDAPCKEILNSIERLLGLPESNKEEPQNTESGEPQQSLSEENSENLAESNETGAVEQDEDVVSRAESVEKILDGLVGRERKLAESLLSRVEENERLNFDLKSHEIIIDNERLMHSNIRALILKCIKVRAPVLPTYLLEFISVLVDAKCPLNLFQDSDVINIRRGVLKLKKQKEIEKEVEKEAASPLDGKEGGKRVREEDEGDVEEEENLRPPKVQKLEEKKGKKRKLIEDTADEVIPVKRSSRLQLKQTLKNQWREIEQQNE